MKEHNIDQLFGQKLREHRVTPTPAAWDKVADGLKTKRRKRGGYFSAAAAVTALLLTTAWFLLQENSPVDSQQHTTVAVREQAPATQAPSVGTESQLAQEIGANTAQEAEPLVPEQKSDYTSSPASLDQAETAKGTNELASNGRAGRTSQEPLEVQQKPDELQQVQQEIFAETETNLALAQPIAPINPNTTIVEEPEALTLPSAAVVIANAEDVVIRYETASAAEKKRDNAPEKVLSILQRVKQGEIGLADIRQAKDNLLSGRINKP